jgi:hypothetical protein
MQALLELFEQTEAKAVELSKIVPAAPIFVAICGIEIEIEQFEIVDGFAAVRKVTNPPGLVHVARAANRNQLDYLGISRILHKSEPKSQSVFPIFVEKRAFFWELLGI